MRQVTNTCLLAFALLVCNEIVVAQKYRICVVDGKGGYRKSTRYCPLLETPDSRVECVIGLDRLDCLRKISKGTADFSVFTAEDLVTAANSEIEILITNELRFTPDEFEYEVVAVINDDAGISGREDLRGKKLCHPGYGYQTEWSQILANYLEASVVPQSCDSKLTLTENRIKASSEFFKAACKAGPWVDDPVLDSQLKNEYYNLCDLCGDPGVCSKNDKYWGRRGPLFCLTDGAGDITWARLDDVQSHFGIKEPSGVVSQAGYSFLCPDGTTRPVNASKPCVWVAKPWQVVATQRSSAQDIQRLISMLVEVDQNSWQSALLNLIENYYITIHSVDPIMPIQSYLDSATGFLSANSFTGCHPPRTVKICTTSNIENAKCSWIRESAVVNGIEPDMDCLKADNTTHCMQALNDNVADVVMVPPDLFRSATQDYHLKPLFYETVYDSDKYFTLAVVKKTSYINNFNDLEGMKACFPTYDGVAWNSVIQTFQQIGLIDACPFTEGVAKFFGPSCVPGLPRNASSKLTEICKASAYDGEVGAMKCLAQGQGDVAFVSKTTFIDFLKSSENRAKYKIKDFKSICTGTAPTCQLSWAPAGYGMVRANQSDMWLKDTLNMFLQLDNLFGRSYTSLTPAFTLFNPFDKQSNVLFHDYTVKLREHPTVKNTDKMDKEYESVLSSIKTCSSSCCIYPVLPLISLLTVFLFFKSIFCES